MVQAIRFVFFVLDAAVVQIVHGVGLAALILAIVLGWRGAGIVWAFALIFVFAVLAHVIFAEATGAGKVANALSNVVFEALVYAVIVAVGYAFGAIIGRANHRRARRE
jgi:hypothetical protein